MSTLHGVLAALTALTLLLAARSLRLKLLRRARR